MKQYIPEIFEFLNSLSVDTSQEQTLLSGMVEQSDIPTILVAGSPDGGVLTLLPLEEPLFTGEDVPGFPVHMEYGPEFSVRVTNHRGETERYRTAGDFRHFCAGRFAELTQCTVTAPAALLRRVKLRFRVLDGSSQEQVVPGCTGCVLVVSGDAGCLTDADVALCEGLASVWCLAGRTSMILRHRGPFGNDLLPVMARQYLGRNRLTAISCGMGNPDFLPEDRGLEAAVMDILDREERRIPTQVLDGCLGRIREKLEVRLREIRKLDEDRLRGIRDLRNAEETFRAMCLTEKYSLGDLLTQEHMDQLRKEIHDLFQVLQVRFPEMVREVADTHPDAKEDLKNLAGDYLSALADAFLDQLLDQITRQQLLPRTQEQFLSVCQRFRRLMEDLGMEYAEPEARAQAEFLRLSEINMGEFQTDFAQVAGMLAGKAVRIVLNYALMKLQIDWGYLLLEDAEEFAREKMTQLTDWVMPAGMYADRLAKNARKQLEEMEKQFYTGLEETVLPRLIHVLQEEFDQLTGAYAAQFEKEIADMEDLRQMDAALTRELEKQLWQVDFYRESMRKEDTHE